jgi:hypothetical protein
MELFVSLSLYNGGGIITGAEEGDNRNWLVSYVKSED